MNKFKGGSARLVAALASGIMLAISACSGAAQTPIPSPYTDISAWTDISAYLASPLAQPPAVQGLNSSTIIQNGSGNTATVDVTVPSAVGTGTYYGNVTSQTQNGSGNTSNLRAVGNGNTLTTSQAGDNNTSSITVFGSSNIINNTQTNLQPGTPGLSYTLQRVGSGQSISTTQQK